MTSADRHIQGSAMPTPRRVLCIIYGIVAVAALIATWAPNLAYTPSQFMDEFLGDLQSTPASRSYAGDLLLLALAAVIFMVCEARKHAIKYVWVYVVGGFITAIGFTFPLFLIARELRITGVDSPKLTAADTILLIVVAVAVAAHVVVINAM